MCNESGEFICSRRAPTDQHPKGNTKRGYIVQKLTDSSDGRRIFVLGELCRERLYDRIRTVDVRLLSVPEDTPGTARIIKTVLGAGRAVQVYPSGRLHHDVAQNDVAKGSPTRT